MTKCIGSGAPCRKSFQIVADPATCWLLHCSPEELGRVMNIVEISDRFANELDVIEFFEMHRWGDTPVCPYCHSSSASARTKDHRFKCYNCSKTYSVTVNTHLHDTRLPLKKWLFAFSIIADAKKGVSAMQLQRNLSISYPTAFKMYHTIREIMAAENRNQHDNNRVRRAELTTARAGRKKESSQEKKKSAPGIVSLKNELRSSSPVNILSLPAFRGTHENETSVPRLLAPGWDETAELVGIVMKDISDEKLVAMIERAVFDDEFAFLPGKTQQAKCINTIIDRVVISHKKLCTNKGVGTNTIESFWTAIKRQIIGQHHHITVRHFPKYVSETVFKYLNRREDLMFEKLVRQSMEETQGLVSFT